MGFSAYFLVVWDLVRYAKSSGIRVGPGPGERGRVVRRVLPAHRRHRPDPATTCCSSGSSTRGRKQMPDIDMDFDSRYRGDMIKYAAERYGWDHVAQIVTFSTIKARAAVRDGVTCPRVPVHRRRQDRQAHAAADHGPRHAAARVPRACARPRGRLQDGRRAARALRDRRRRQARHRRRPRPRGAAPPGRDPRRGGGDHPASRSPSTCRSSASPSPAATSRTRRSSRSTRCTASRTSACSRWTSSACATSRDRAHARARRAESGGARPDIDNVAARRPQDVRDAAQRRHDRCVPARRWAGARAAALAAPTTFEDVSALVALYRPGPDGRRTWHTEYADRKNGRKPVTYYHARRPRGDPRARPTG